MNKKVALVTNAVEYVTPTSAKALLKDGYEVIACDKSFQVST
ncbi:MAG: hypothetical protein ACN4E2_07125 [Nitrospinota bacterium]